MKVAVEKATPEKVRGLGAEAWPIWTCDVSEFDWSYDEKETCWLLEGDVEVVTPDGRVSFGGGDLVVFPRGLSCRWVVKKAVKKHYKFG
jgi:uncharacterized protein